MHAFKLRLVALLGLAALLAPAAFASAQTVLAGAGVQSVSGDDTDQSGVAFGEVAFRLGRVGAGVEFARLGSFHSTGSSLPFVTADRTGADRALVVIVSGRVVRSRRFSIDVCGGAGVDTRHEIVTTTYQPLFGLPPTAPTTEALTLHSAVWVVGLDAPVRVFRFLSVVPRFRFYDAPGLGEGKVRSSTSWQAVGVGIRVHW